MQKVLIIDDDNRNIFALTAILKSRGYECISATSAQQGIAFLNNIGDIGIVLLDMMMPDMDGYEAIPVIHAKVDVPIIAVTAQAMLGDKERCLAAGADDYISKPIDIDRLEEVMKRYLNN
jgi:two-component system cell cycle response regulator DivK